MTYRPDYPRASDSPTIIMLVAGLTGVLGFLLGYLTGLGSGELAAAPAPRVTVTVEAQPPEDPGAQPSDGLPADQRPPDTQPTSDPASGDPGDVLASLRTFVVGVDIQPGTYSTTGPAGGTGQCYWARMSSTAGGLGDVIDAGMPDGPATVTIQPTDKSFQTAGCAEWTSA